MQIELSEQDILSDIRAYEVRLQKAQDALQMLPGGYVDYKEYKKREKLKKEYVEEIKHVEHLISLAQEALKNATA